MTATPLRHSVCKVCGCPIQRGSYFVDHPSGKTHQVGTVADGVSQHYKVVHPDRTPDDPLRPEDWWARQGGSS